MLDIAALPLAISNMESAVETSDSLRVVAPGAQPQSRHGNDSELVSPNILCFFSWASFVLLLSRTPHMNHLASKFGGNMFEKYLLCLRGESRRSRARLAKATAWALGTSRGSSLATTIAPSTARPPHCPTQPANCDPEFDIRPRVLWLNCTVYKPAPVPVCHSFSPHFAAMDSFTTFLSETGGADSPLKGYRIATAFSNNPGDIKGRRAELRFNMHKKSTCIGLDDFLAEFMPEPTKPLPPSGTTRELRSSKTDVEVAPSPPPSVNPLQGLDKFNAEKDMYLSIVSYLLQYFVRDVANLLLRRMRSTTLASAQVISSHRPLTRVTPPTNQARRSTAVYTRSARPTFWGSRMAVVTAGPTGRILR